MRTLQCLLIILQPHCTLFSFAFHCLSVIMDKFCLFDIESDDEEEKMLNSVLNKIDNELKEIYPSYLTKLTSAVHFEKIESNAGCSKFNYNAGDNGYVVNDSEDSFTSEPYDKSEREEKRESDATIIKDLDDEMGVTAETFITFFAVSGMTRGPLI